MSVWYEQKIKSSTKQVARKDVRYLWHNDYWDGPMSGACLYQGERLWFKIFHEGVQHRKFVLLRLNENQWKELDFRHLKFQNYVGTHTDYDENGKRHVGSAPLIESDPDKFYKWAKKNPAPNIEGEQVAWYRNPCNKEKKEQEVELC